MKGTLTAILVLSLARAVSAHHTVADTFDVSKAVPLNGVITSVQWQNPHVIYGVLVTAMNGTPVQWTVESRHPDGMRRAGVAPDTFEAGDTVMMNVLLARDGSPRAATVSLILPDGRTVRVCTVTNDRCPEP